MKSKLMPLTKIVLTLTMAALLMLTAACGSGGSNANQAAGNEGNAANASEQAAANNSAQQQQKSEYPLTLKDVTGTELTFQSAPARIVSLLPSETEIVYAVDAGASLVAVDNYSNYPKEAESLPKIGDMDADIEKIVSLKPDLVLASYTMGSAVVDKLRSLQIPVFATDPKTYDAVMEKVKQIGEILDKNEQAAAVTAQMEQVREQVVNAVKDAPKRNVYLEFAPGWTVGKGEFLDELITLAGGINIASEQGWYEIDPESVVKSNPDQIIYASMTLAEGEKNPILTGIETRPGWATINAIKNKQVFEVDQDPLTRVGPRLADGLLEVAKKLHPDLFK
ncbi:ABC transporter substrate-binding protein [Paenibacillus lignilyticus]|uniref:ABC transporter substrate-binding protein n=1 Tax=Paenibacillus lignilyticus TaxID=1172615 RepID=A0ABS5CH51_9BACL|nr:ABC transporter substrate-binding protein [Paenibacillus lignilyticus]MBP3965165.1 ABC transporter substrate-binding protein [Paenibacillus lignilyticus]